MKGVDNYLSISPPLTVCECRAGTCTKEKGNRFKVCWTRKYLVYLQVNYRRVIRVVHSP
jgi:hypothetical protein